MNEIEKLYENAGIKPTKNWQSCLNCKLKTETLYDEWGEEYLTCIRLERPEECFDAKEYYPIFIAEKQLKLIKWLAKFDVRIEYTNAKYFIESHHHGYSVYMKYFEQALAGFLNTLWQDLTEEEKQQIKDILE